MNPRSVLWLHFLFCFGLLLGRCSLRAADPTPADLQVFWLELWDQGGLKPPEILPLRDKAEVEKKIQGKWVGFLGAEKKEMHFEITADEGERYENVRTVEELGKHWKEGIRKIGEVEVTRAIDKIKISPDMRSATVKSTFKMKYDSGGEWKQSTEKTTYNLRLVDGKLLIQNEDSEITLETVQ